MKEAEEKVDKRVVAVKKLVDLDADSLVKKIVEQKAKDFLKEKERVFQELISVRVAYTGRKDVADLFTGNDNYKIIEKHDGSIFSDKFKYTIKFVG